MQKHIQYGRGLYLSGIKLQAAANLSLMNEMLSKDFFSKLTQTYIHIF